MNTQNDALTTIDGIGGELAVDPKSRQADIIKGVLAAREEALVKARATVAMGRPRSIERVRQILKEDCEREGFAEVAYYRIKNRGEGLSVHFARAAMRAMTNMDARSTIIHDDADMRIIEVSVVDFESNSAVTNQVIVQKTVERKYLKKGEVAISQRMNSYGDIVFERRATEEEVTPKQNAMVSKSTRNGIMSFVPGDIQHECKQRILQIWEGHKTMDVKTQIRKVIDSFATLNVTVDNLVEYLGHGVETSSPSELEELRNLYRSINSGETSWHAETSKSDGEPQSDKPKTNAEKLKEELEQKAKGKAK